MASPYIKIVDEKNFSDEVFNSALPVMIDFYADWCGPCKSLTPTLEKFAADNQLVVKVIKINVDDCPELAKKYGVKSIPTVILLNEGRALSGVVGNVPRSMLDDLLKQIPPPPPTLENPAP